MRSTDVSRVRATRPRARPLGLALLAAFWLFLPKTAPATADAVEMVMVPSIAMGRDIPVAFRAGGPHVAVLLDTFNAGPEVSNWVGANAFNALAGKGISVAAPAGGAWSLYTNWEQDSGKQWETFLADELPNWLSVNKGLAPGGHGIVGAGQGGTGALTIAAFHPDRYRYAGALSGLLTPSRTEVNGAITAGLARFGGLNADQMWGPAQLGRWKWRDPDAHAALLASNHTRLWVFSPSTTQCTDPAAMLAACDQAVGSSRQFYQHYRDVTGRYAHFDISAGGQHDWGTWGPQLAAMADDLAGAIR